MQCPFCATNAPETARFCPDCGRLLGKMPPPLQDDHPEPYPDVPPDTWKRQLLAIMAMVLVTALVIGFYRYRSTHQPPVEETGSIPGMQAAVSDFFTANPEAGIAQGVKDMPDWYKGTRQQVTVYRDGKTEYLLFYLSDDRVVSVYRETDAGREIFWKE